MKPYLKHTLLVTTGSVAGFALSRFLDRERDSPVYSAVGSIAFLLVGELLTEKVVLRKKTKTKKINA